MRLRVGHSGCISIGVDIRSVSAAVIGSELAP
jgi:hypothetical protein